MEIITSRKNPLFQTLRRLNASPAARRKEGLFLGEGPRLLEEAARWGNDIRLTVSTPGFPLPEGLTCRQVETPEHVFRSVSDTETPQGVLFACGLPDTALPRKLEQGRYLVLDGVQDPGNLGTIWRTAAAFECKGIFLAGPCADPFGPKAVRATMGACFRLPVWRGEPEEIKALLNQNGIPLYAAALGENAEDARSVNLSRSAVIIGSEGKGVSEELLARAEKRLRIPMDGKSESLNAAVAAAVILWEGYRGKEISGRDV